MEEKLLKDISELSGVEQFLQIFAVLIYVNIVPVSFLLVLIISPFVLFKLSSLGCVIFISYFIFIYFDNAIRFSNENGRGLLFLIRQNLSNNFKHYFPVELIKTVDLKADRNYIFASFPHGISCMGIYCNMSKMNGEFLKQFPGIMPRIATLNMYFWIPIVREMMISRHLISCSKNSIKSFLNKGDQSTDGFTSNAVVISVGGLKELFQSTPGVYILKLLNRKGFVKIAIETGSPIVPTFTFGEVDLYDHISLPKNILFQKFTYIALNYILAKCFLINLPKRKRLVQVVGTPIEVEKLPNPTPEYVDEIHQKVIDGLHDIFRTHKHKYLENPQTAELIIK